MKKAYIEPKNTVVSIQTEQFIAQSSLREGEGTRGADADSRETIKIPGAWEEW